MACCMFQSPVGVHLLQLRATMRMEAVPLGSDVVVVIATRPADTPTLILETNPNHTHAAVTLSFVSRFLTALCPPEVPTHLSHLTAAARVCCRPVRKHGWELHRSRTGLVDSHPPLLAPGLPVQYRRFRLEIRVGVADSLPRTSTA